MSPTAEAFLCTLNGAFVADPATIHALVCVHVPCNLALADDPFVQVCENESCGGYNVGVLGILNGILEPLTGERIAFAWDDDKDHPHPLGFRLYQPQTQPA